MVLRGAHRGARAQLLDIDVGTCRAREQFVSGGSKGAEASFEHDDISKVCALTVQPARRGPHNK